MDIKSMYALCSGSEKRLQSWSFCHRSIVSILGIEERTMLGLDY
jgi:hypothetical protein